MLFKDRALNIAILISASWHLVCVLAVAPVLLPQRPARGHAAISFLGSILENVNPLKEAPSAPKRVLSGVSAKEIALGQPDLLSDIRGAEQEKDESPIGAAGYRDAADFKAGFRKEQPEIKLSDLMLKGEARDRAVLYKPELKKADVLPSDFNSDYAMNIMFKISREGFVKEPQCVISSGAPEIDRIGMRYIRGWRFMPSEKDNQEGVIRISLEAAR